MAKFKDAILYETMHNGDRKMALSRIFLIIFLSLFIATLFFLMFLINKRPQVDEIDLYVKLLESRIEGVRLILQSLEWIIGFFLIYVFGSKGLSWIRPAVPVNANQNQNNYGEDGDSYNINIDNDEYINKKKKGTIDDPLDIR